MAGIVREIRSLVGDAVLQCIIRERRTVMMMMKMMMMMIVMSMRRSRRMKYSEPSNTRRLTNPHLKNNCYEISQRASDLDRLFG
jgi:hypothetical protein